MYIPVPSDLPNICWVSRFCTMPKTI